MKTKFKFIIAAMAAISVFSSCQKELANESVSNTTEGVRTISVQFDNSTKASLSDFTPTFTNNDKIRVSNTEKSEECTITIDNGGTPTFTTTLSGALTAIYPADAAVFTGNGSISDPYFKVPASQTGKVEDAIIAKADITAESSTATFNVQTALFEITPPSGATTITIKSLKPVVDGVARTGTAQAINTDGATAEEKLVIEVSVFSGKAYVALVPGVNLSDLSFEYITDATNGLGAMKGIPTNDIKALASSSGKTFDQVNATAANTKYTIGNTNWHPYVEIQVEINGDSKTYKWATMNIGATSATEAGKYFAWGETTGHAAATASSNAFVFGTDNAGFAWKNCPYAVGGKSKFNKYVPASKTSYFADGFTGDTKTVLDLADDAANANWGGSWRMPTKAEFQALASKKRGDFSSGYNFGESDTQQIFLPAAGFGNGTDLYFAGVRGYYWYSSLYTDYPVSACYLVFSAGDASTSNDDRYYGRSVRALSE